MPTTTSTRPAAAPFASQDMASIAEDVAGVTFSRALVVGVTYGLVGWFHLVLIPAYAFAGMVDARNLDPYPVGPLVWAGAYIFTGLLTLGIALGLVNGRGWAWHYAPWAVVPNLVVHAIFFAVLPVWGIIAVVSDVFVMWLVVRERRHYQAMLAAATVAAGHPRHPAAPAMSPSAAIRRPR